VKEWIFKYNGFNPLIRRQSILIKQKVTLSLASDNPSSMVLEKSEMSLGGGSLTKSAYYHGFQF
jgi:hypothetical protein